MKRCPKCKLVKDDLAFGLRGPSRPGRLKSHCRKCEADRQKVRAKANPKAVRERFHNWFCENREERNAARRTQYAENPEPHRLRHRLNNQKEKYSQKQYATDPNFRILAKLRSRLSAALKERGARKAASTLVLLGCPLWHLKAHFDFLFKPGMTWENKGAVWQIDHIKPCAKFDLTDPEQQKACFHWTNLQPLFARDNLQKGAK